MKVKTNVCRHVIYCLAGLFLSMAVNAKGISVEYATGNVNDNVYSVNARIAFNFDDEVLNALNHGVSLAINIYMRLLRKRDWLWDKLMREDVLEFELQYHPLSNNYLVINTSTGQREQFQSLEEALNFLGSIKNYRLAHRDELEKENNYRGQIKAELNIESLPPPLQPTAYVSSQWQLESQWYEWVVR